MWLDEKANQPSGLECGELMRIFERKSSGLINNNTANMTCVCPEPERISAFIKIHVTDRAIA